MPHFVTVTGASCIVPQFLDYDTSPVKTCRVSLNRGAFGKMLQYASRTNPDINRDVNVVRRVSASDSDVQIITNCRIP